MGTIYSSILLSFLGIGLKDHRPTISTPMSESEVVNKQQVTAQSLLTSSQVAGLLQMNRASVNKWVRDGRLSAYKTPGGHHRIRVSDLVTFLAEHQLPIPPSLQPMMRQLVLVVDDDTDQLVAFKRALTRYQKRIRVEIADNGIDALVMICLLYTSPSPRDATLSRMPSSA